MSAILAFVAANWPGILGVVGTAVCGTAWAKAQVGWKRKLLDALASMAVAKTESEFVAPHKEKTGKPTLSYAAASTAKSMAVNDVVTALAPILGPGAARLAPAAGDAIEAVIKRIHEKLPEKTQSRFDRFRVIVFLLMPLIGLSLAGCFAMSLPLGWSESDADALDRVVATCAETVYIESDDATVQALQRVGEIGAAAFRTAVKATDDKEMQVQGAVISMQNAAASYQELFGGRALGSVIRDFTHVEAVDADQVLGLLYAALERAA